jgi:hypothetical protein
MTGLERERKKREREREKERERERPFAPGDFKVKPEVVFGVLRGYPASLQPQWGGCHDPGRLA